MSTTSPRTIAELVALTGAGRPVKYLHFWGNKPALDGGVGAGCLSQWWRAEFTVDIWGIGLSATDSRADDPARWRGLNLVGWPEGARSGPGDTDLVVYSLRRYLGLATKGNPTVLLPLFAPSESVLVLNPLGEELRALAPALLSQRAVRRFLGYMDGQRQRLIGAGRGRPNRPELVARYGYDVKYAAHALRLAYQGLEIVRDGRLTLPMPPHERERVLRIKRGDVPHMLEVLDEIASVATTVEQLLTSGRTPLPPEPDWDAISSWSVHAHRRHWCWR